MGKNLNLSSPIVALPLVLISCLPSLVQRHDHQAIALSLFAIITFFVTEAVTPKSLQTRRQRLQDEYIGRLMGPFLALAVERLVQQAASPLSTSSSTSTLAAWLSSLSSLWAGSTTGSLRFPLFYSALFCSIGESFNALRPAFRKIVFLGLCAKQFYGAQVLRFVGGSAFFQTALMAANSLSTGLKEQFSPQAVLAHARTQVPMLVCAALYLLYAKWLLPACFNDSLGLGLTYVLSEMFALYTVHVGLDVYRGLGGQATMSDDLSLWVELFFLFTSLGIMILALIWTSPKLSFHLLHPKRHVLVFAGLFSFLLLSFLYVFNTLSSGQTDALQPFHLLLSVYLTGTRKNSLLWGIVPLLMFQGKLRAKFPYLRDALKVRCRWSYSELYIQ